MDDKLDKLIAWLNGITYSGGLFSLGSLVMYKEQITLLISLLTFVLSLLLGLASLYFQNRKHKREVKESNARILLYEAQMLTERRLRIKADTGQRSRVDDD